LAIPSQLEKDYREKMPTPKIVAIMPAYNAGRTLEQTVREIPEGSVQECIVVDDVSADATVEIARRLGLRVFLHGENQGYGGNQKTCYVEALKTGADIVVMLHPDYQYDPKKIPDIVRPIVEDRADLVLGSRMAYAVAGGMPFYKRLSNRFLTWCENKVFGLQLSEYHTGFRAFRRSLLATTPFILNSNDFIFDQEIMAQAVWFGARIEEISVPHRYFPEASTIGFGRSVRYGFGVLGLLVKFFLSRKGMIHSRLFRPLHHAYSEVSSDPAAAPPATKT
jgi:glycosyltransferase involved in cell wall biosynthesis